MRVTVHYNRLPIPPRKLRAVLHHVRGAVVANAIARLDASPRLTAEPLRKLLRASISAAQDKNPNLKGTDLRVAEVFCNDAMRLYRTRRKSKGRAGRFAKRGSHLTLSVEPIVTPKAPTPKAEPKAAEVKAETPKTEQTAAATPKRRTTKKEQA